MTEFCSEEKMSVQKELKDILPILGVEHNCILSKMGDITIAYEVQLLTNGELSGNRSHYELVEPYLNLQPNESSFLLHDITFNDGIQVGNNNCPLFTLADAADLPGYCVSRINYDKYSTDKTKFSVGFAGPLGQLLSENFFARRLAPVSLIQNKLIYSENPII